MDYETLVQIDETLESLAGMLTEGPAGGTPQSRAMFAKAWSRTPGPGQAATKARGTQKGAEYYRKFRKTYATSPEVNKSGGKLNIGAAHGNLKGKVKELTVPARRKRSKTGDNFRKKK